MGKPTEARRPDHDDSGAPYSVCHLLVRGVGLPEFELGRYSGLRYCSLVRDGPGARPRLITGWDSRDRYLASWPDFEADVLGRAAPVLEWSGFDADFRAPKRRFRDKLSPREWLLAFAAVLGALVTVHTYYAQFLTPPEFEFLESDRRQDVLSHDARVVVKARNVGDSSLSVRIEEIRVLDADGVETSQDVRGRGEPRTLHSIPPGGTSELDLRLTLGVTGNIDLVLLGSAKGGTWLPRRTVRVMYPLRAWSALPNEPVKADTHLVVFPNRCIVTLGFDIGMECPDGVEFSAIYDGGQDISIGKAAGSRIVFSDVSTEDTVPGVLWRTHRLPPFTRMMVTFPLRSETQRDRKAWRQIVDGLEFRREILH